MGAILKHSSIHSAAVLLHQGGATVEAVKGGMTQQTPFATASVSKLYTHAIVFRLIDQGLVGYDAELGSLLPAEEVGRLPHGASVTVRQLIDQTTSFADFESERQCDGTVLLEQLLRPGGDRAVDYDDALGILARIPAKRTPGRRAHYSDANAMVLGRVAEAVAGVTIHHLLDEAVCRPLGLTATHYAVAGERVEPVYHGKRAVECGQYLASQMARGGVIATNTELMAFLRAFFNGGLFDPAHITDPVFRPIQFVPLRYGSGMMRLAVPRVLSPLVPAPEIVGHSGTTGSFAFYCPSKDAYVCGTINQIARRPFDVVYRMLATAR